LSGDGEPTICPNFLEVVETVVHARARGRHPFFKVVLITNASHLDAPGVEAGLSLFTAKDEVWAKLDAGTQAFMDRINRSTVPLGQILANILRTARRRPVIIQSLFSIVDGETPTQGEILEFAQRLRELREAGAKIPLVQIYSATRPVQSRRVAHLPLRTMRQIAATVGEVAGLRAEVF
jgi:wyosine [tRNA(Phe)-imidazoG37] synthetase (radical SAM superfamily)